MKTFYFTILVKSTSPTGEIVVRKYLTKKIVTLRPFANRSTFKSILMDVFSFNAGVSALDISIISLSDYNYYLNDLKDEYLLL